uniref:Uncharacterized protein n=1 Tax=Populus trichocarpa TaxID=3694 RepID=A0A3N7GSL9_POPTR
MISDENAGVSRDKSKGLIWEKHCCCRWTGRNFGARAQYAFMTKRWAVS